MGKALLSYEDFFGEVQRFKDKQSEQKARGVNEYNLLSTVLPIHDEVRLHSRTIASLLDPNGSHFQGGLFLSHFLKMIAVDDFDIENTIVKREYKNIDIYITDQTKHLIIENKIYACDQNEQIKRYIEEIEKESNVNSHLPFQNNIMVVYLSLDRSMPSDYSLGDLRIDSECIKREGVECAKYKALHYKTEILKWLEECKKEVSDITNLNESLAQYIQVVQKITNQYKGKIMQLDEMLSKNKDYYKLAREISKAYPRAKQKLEQQFWNDVLSKLEGKSIKPFNSNQNSYDFKLIDMADEHKVVLHIGNDLEKGIFFTIAKFDKNNKWAKITNQEKDKIAEQIAKLKGNFYPFNSDIDWAYCTCRDYEFDLRDDNIFACVEDIDGFAKKIESIISDFR